MKLDEGVEGKGFWAKLWCAHCWLSVGWFDRLSTQWKCHKCGKVKLYDIGYIPLSYISDHPDHGDLL